MPSVVSRRSLFGLVGGGFGALVVRAAGVEAQAPSSAPATRGIQWTDTGASTIVRNCRAISTIEPPAPVRYYGTITVSGNTTMFTENIETLLVEERLAFPVNRPSDFSTAALI